jgi:hypothetical protein
MSTTVVTDIEAPPPSESTPLVSKRPNTNNGEKNEAAPLKEMKAESIKEQLVAIAGAASCTYILLLLFT